MSRLRYRPPVTKLYPPSTDTRLLDRPDLVATLVSLQQRKLAVVTAPTGSGKSTLLAQGFRKLVAAGWEAAWLSLDRFDNEPRVFVLNLVAALAQVRPGFGDQITSLVQASGELPLTEAMAAIIAECAVRGAAPGPAGDAAQPLVIFLDDFQVIDSADVVAALGYLIQYSGAETRFVVASQRQVPLSVARLKSRGAVVEIGFAELRLAADEVREYLRRVHRVALSDAHVAALTDQTEGWICGLQLASIAYREHGAALFDREPPGRPMAGQEEGREEGLEEGVEEGVEEGRGERPRGDHKAVGGFADYLLEDILARQTPAMRAFLQETALLDQFCAPLCDAITGREDGTEMIEALEQANLFIIRLDREQIWYRYHHLFQNFLRLQKRAQGLARVRPSYLRASRWYEQNALPAEALRHALAGGSLRDAVRLLEGYGYALLREGSFKELHGWLQAVGRKGVSSSAELNVLNAWTQLYLGDAIAASEAIESAQAVLESPSRRNSAHDPARNPARDPKRISDELLILRSMCGVTRYDLADSEWITPDLATAFGLEDGLQRAYAQVVLGYCARVKGELGAARRHYVEAIRIADSNEDTVVSLMARYNRAMVDQLAARPDIAIRGLTQWLEEPGNRRWLRAGSAAFLRSVLGLAHLDRLEFVQAEAALDAAIELLDATHTFAYVGVARILRAQVYAMTQRLDQARDDIDKAREIGAARSIDRVLFRAAIAQARIALAADPAEWRERELDQVLAEARQVLEASRQVDREIATENFVQYEAVCCQRLYRRAVGREAFAELLARAESAAQGEARAGRVKHQVEFLGLQALAARALGDASSAQRDLMEAIRLATPGGAALALIHCGPDLLKIRVGEQPGSTAAMERLRGWFGLLEKAGTAPAAVGPTVQPLHRRERQILQLVEQGLRNREIGERLYISEETVKWYLKRVYEALGVKNRAHALARVRQLKLLGSA
jgi:LuxR family maltose regulon positive regulatory protein